MQFTSAIESVDTPLPPALQRPHKRLRPLPRLRQQQFTLSAVVDFDTWFRGKQKYQEPLVASRRGSNQKRSGGSVCQNCFKYNLVFFFVKGFLLPPSFRSDYLVSFNNNITLEGKK